MKIEYSNHIDSIRHATRTYPLVRCLDVEQLLQILPQLENATSIKGKKRAASPVDDSQHASKKARSGDYSNGILVDEAVQIVEHRQHFPAAEVLRQIPVYRHILEIAYTTSSQLQPASQKKFVDDQEAQAFQWIQQEEELELWLKSHNASSASRGSETTEKTFEVGDLLLYNACEAQLRGSHQCTHLRLFADLVGFRTSMRAPFLVLPNLEPNFDADAYDLRTPNISDPLLACFWLSLARPKRANVSARLQLVVNPHVADLDPSIPLLPFRLRVQFDVSFNLPAILESPISPKGHRDLAEVQRRVLLHIFPYGPPPDAFHGHVDIPLLYSILGPAPRMVPPAMEEALQPEELVPTLLPFQRRSVGWMLAREGKAVDASGNIVMKSHVEPSGNLLFWEAAGSGSGRQVWYVNRLRGEITSSAPAEEDAKGGILAEEPGLGKTLECITLILLNPAIGRNPSNQRWDAEAKVHVKEVKTTLIVTPASLAPQWLDEFALHAPGLKVLLYEGWTKTSVPITQADAARARAKRQATRNMKRAGGSRSQKGKKRLADSNYESEADPDDDDNEGKLTDWCSYVSEYDVCITTFNTLQQDLNVARAPPTRPRRSTAEYSRTVRPRSPLILCEWYRVIMDEVQMVGGGKAEEMVSLIPRISSFAVSGTPARAQVADLVHVLKFLRVGPALQPRIWQRLLTPGYVNEFVSLFQRHTVRTMKSAVKDELTIPPQTRYLVPIELGRVERHVYDQNFENALLELGLDARGVAVREDWEPDTAVLRTWLRKLRGICTHPQVGQLHDHTGLHRAGVLKSIGDVLEGMRDQNRRNLLEDWRTKIQAMTTVAQLQQHDELDPLRYRHALDTLLAAEKEANSLIAYVKNTMVEHAEKGKALKEEAAQRKEALERHGEGQPASNGEVSKGKGKDREEREDTPMSDLTDLEDEGLPKNPAGEEHTVKRRALQQRLRECRITLHKVLFLEGDVYHVLGESFAEDESKAYAAAEDLRRVLLKGTEEAAQHAMMQLNRNKAIKSLRESDLLIKVPYCDKGGIKSSHLMEEANEMIDGLLNRQSALLWTWREKLKELLTKPLTSSDEDVDGQEYARSLDTQGEAEAYLQAYAALLADRREAMTAERTLLAAHDVRETKARRTKAARKAEEAMQEEQQILELETLEDGEKQPEHQVLEQQLTEERKAFLEDFDPGRAVRSIMVELSNIAARITKEDDPEKIIAKDGATRLRTLIAEQSKLMDRLQGDLSALRKAFNERILYFRQLQEISDTVAEAEWEGQVEAAIATARTEMTELEAKINTGRARQRYMDHLTKAQEDGTIDEDDKCCILCRCEFTRGYITQCAHVFCETCMKEWLGQRAGKACPVCRVPIHQDQLQRFSIDQKQELRPPPQLIKRNELVPRSRRLIQYNVIDPAVFEDIQSMESFGSYGSKIQTLVRHLLYLSVTDSGSKSIVFSAWADSLHIIEHALQRNGISCLRIDQNRGKQNAAKRFRIDPTISVLLLHGERENAGLNVTCARRVFLLESVVNHAFEIQAIARIDRMGQQNPTGVFCYYAEDTVERNILDLAAKQGLSLYTKDNSAGTLNVSPLTAANTDKKQVDSPAKKAQKGDFVSKTDDMLAIFFPHLFEDLEYLVPAEEQPTAHAHGSGGANAIAGPSRLAL